jgi:uncharacterized protein
LRLFHFFAALLLLTLGGCSKPADESISAPAEPGRPALWMIESPEGQKAWLFGTIHVLPPGTDWQSDVLDKALHEARTLVLEASGLDDQEAVAKVFSGLAVRGGLPPLSARVDPSLKPALNAAVARSKVPPHALDKMESWAVALIIASTQGSGMGLEQDQGVEQVLIRRYKADEKPISGLETVSGQLGIFDQLPEKEQRAMLNAILRGAGESRDGFKAQFEAWHNGEIDELIQDDGEGILASPLLREKLLDGRNRAWASQIEALLADNSEPFIAVGAAHLPGDTGVVALLEAKGFRLQRLQ